MFSSTGSLCPVLQRAPQPCYRSRCSSPRNILTWERKRKEMDRLPFAINQSIACLGRMVVLVLLPVMWFIFFYLRVSFFVLCNLGANSPSTPFPGRETVRIVHDCHGRGECLFFNVTFCSFVCHSCSFLFLCCFPAACPLLLLFLSRRARTRHTP